ncbi:transcriptional regulator [Enterococcus florum]|uniref:Transcriptional regulator n=1 Tax=Enterococcus florum TaxID=2480627 RepID=A0A4P5PEY8_9ENTE|nr:winged helix-turn-helix domain-containing protein [Enterococcus florum]GCF94768.1 transcriptional regulator [Enterococcus florum]
MQILVLTKNILVEQTLQEQLQRLNHEVFVSSSLLQPFGLPASEQTLIDFFQVVIFDETLSDSEVLQFLEKFQPKRHMIFRKADRRPERVETDRWYDQGVRGWITKGVTVEGLRELLIQTNEQANPQAANVERSSYKMTLHPYIVGSKESREKIPIENFPLTPYEKKMLQLLMKEEGKLYSRDELCSNLWECEITNSKKVQLSSLIKRIKNRFREARIYEELIQTVWGKGYMLTPSFYKYLNVESLLEGTPIKDR